MIPHKINRSAIQIMAEVISNKKFGPYHHMVFAIGEMAANIKPGNFVAISVGGEQSSLILRRAFAIYRAIDKGPMGGSIELVIAPHGQGSTWLCSRAVGDFVDLIGPLGTSFGIPTTNANTMLVGGGYGSAPLFALAELLKNRGCRVDMVLGASTANKIFAPLEGKRTVSSLTLTTDDGSAGIHGQISEAIPRLIRELGTEVIYSCGPMGMLAAIAKIAKDFDIAHQCSVEESMACGIGVCMTCVVPIRNGDGVKMVRTCIDGPVMDGSEIIWDRKEVLDAMNI
ncbi:MAG: dihydroorotate dehydrogenase electron transfer subunit [Actinobacteria bacterium]|jgi:dihydroorotate dehydrogenase electron transfer subunit|nr:dihydroorotate dehydrogenase electron transfer subunit [Actinomycetota bacterium]